MNDKTKTWDSVSRGFHWVMGLLIIGMLAYGWWMNHIVPRGPDRFFHRSIHADVGYVILLLLALRLIWRAFHPRPAFPANSAAWERWLARINQGLLYLFTFGVIMLGWAHSGANARPYSSWFGLFNVPQFTSTDRAAARFYEDWHIYMAYALLALIVLHTLAALYHQFIKRDGVMMRMVSGKPD